MSRVAALKTLIQALTGDSKVDYWAIRHNLGVALAIVILTILDIIFGSYYAGLLAVSYWIGFFTINHSIYTGYKYYTTRNAHTTLSITLPDDTPYTICYRNTTNHFIVFQSLTDKLLHPRVSNYGTSVFIGPLVLSWIQDGAMVQMTEADFYDFICYLEDTTDYAENELWEHLIKHTNTEIFENTLKQGRALNAIESTV